MLKYCNVWRLTEDALLCNRNVCFMKFCYLSIYIFKGGKLDLVPSDKVSDLNGKVLPREQWISFFE